MIPAPPIANLLVIRSSNIDRAVTFYERMGLLFHRHSHGKGPEHYASDVGGFVIEIYPQRNADEITTAIVAEPTDTEWGRRAVLKDFDGHTVELVTPHDRESSIAKYNGGATSTHDAEDDKRESWGHT